MALADPKEFRAYCRERRKKRVLAAKRWLEAKRQQQAINAKQRELKAQHKRQTKTRPGRFGATVLEEFSQAQLDKRIRLLGSCCIYCGRAFQHLDHLVPVMAGGRHAVWNLAPSCRTCNTSKGDSDPLDWVTRKAINKTAVVLVERAVRRHMRRANA